MPLGRPRTLIALCALFAVVAWRGSAQPAAQQDRASVAPTVSRSWSCIAVWTAGQSAFRPATSPCETQVLPLRLERRLTTRVVAPLVAPGAPSSLAAAVSGANVVLIWTAPISGDAPSSYVLEAGSATGLVDLANFDTGSSLPAFTATNVPSGTYYVRVRARNASGTSAASNEIVVTVAGGCATAPDPPSALAVALNGSTVTLSWTAPSAACAATSYVIEAGSASGLTNIATVATGSTATSFTAAGVGSGTYFVRVKAVNGGGTSAASNEVQFTVGACAGPPRAPTGFVAQVSGSTVMFTWNAATGAPTSYILEAGSFASGTDIVVSDTGNLGTTLTATAPPGTYFVRLRARNSCGQSAPTEEIVVVVGSASCATISPSSAVVSNTETLGTVAVTAPDSCAWTAVSNASFITVTAGASGTGSGTVSYKVAANGSGVARTGTVTIAGLTFTITQQVCAIVLSPLIVSAPASGGPLAITLSTSSLCAWTAESNNSFITLTSPASGTGSTNVTFTTQQNTNFARTGTVTIAGQTVRIIQEGLAGFTNCVTDLVRCRGTAGCDAQTFSGGPSTSELVVGAPGDCIWSASATAPWISLFGTSLENQPFGVGDGHFGFSLAANTSENQRSAAIVAGGKTFSITQLGCGFSLSVTSATVPASGASGAITVSSACTTTWTAVSNASFITIVGAASGSGNGSVTVSVEANTTGAARTGTLTIAGQTVTITQLGS
jgi:all-beta uncharacterized protein/fibronectin type III domain protein/PKD domain-containing protein